MQSQTTTSIVVVLLLLLFLACFCLPDASQFRNSQSNNNHHHCEVVRQNRVVSFALAAELVSLETTGTATATVILVPYNPNSEPTVLVGSYSVY
jgi:hypothetical protein